MDNLILQSSKGVHLLFDKEDIVEAFSERCNEDEKNLDKLRKIQEVLYSFISLKEYSEKQNFLKNLSRSEYSLLIRAYFKIVEIPCWETESQTLGRVDSCFFQEVIGIPIFCEEMILIF